MLTSAAFFIRNISAALLKEHFFDFILTIDIKCAKIKASKQEHSFSYAIKNLI